MRVRAKRPIVDILREKRIFPFAEVSYNIALCYYELKQYAQAVQHLGAIVERGIKEYPGKQIRMSSFFFSIKRFYSSRIECWNAN